MGNEKQNQSKWKEIKEKAKTISIQLPTLFFLNFWILYIIIAQLSYIRLDDMMKFEYARLSDSASKLAADMIDPNEVDLYLEEGFNSPEYISTLKKLYRVRSFFKDLKYVYVWKCTPEGGIIIFDLDEEYTDIPLKESISAVGTIYPYDEGFHKVTDKLAAGEETVTEFGYDINGEYLLTTIKPIHNDKGEYVCSVGVDFSMDNFNKDNRAYIFKNMSFIFLIMMTFLLFDIRYIHTKIVGPMSKMVNCLKSFKYTSSSERFVNLAKYEDLNINTHNELEMLYRAALFVGKENLYYQQNFSKAQHDIEEIEEVAYKDELTKVKSKSAYADKVAIINRQISSKKDIDFGILMVDLNDLKKVNDTYGHTNGDTYIKGCCNVFCHIFAHSPVYRIGGDEFIVLLQNNNLEDRERLIEKLEDEFFESYHNIDKPEYERFSASFGLAIYEKDTDMSYEDVYKRPDKLMYEYKRKFKRKCC